VRELRQSNLSQKLTPHISHNQEGYIFATNAFSMGFGFNLFGFPILILTTIGLLLYATRKPSALKVLGLIWATAVVLISTGLLMDYLRQPIKLAKQKIVGEYRIDTFFYPGKNARWQYSHFKFSITNDDSIYFTVLDDKQKTLKAFHHKISYNTRFNSLLWSINTASTHHVIKNLPTLYRSHKKFYYVFESPKYGNMFFRRISSSD
jgi:hypothetical protein